MTPLCRLVLAACITVAVGGCVTPDAGGKSVIPTDVTLSQGTCGSDPEGQIYSLDLTVESGSSYALVTLSGNLVDEGNSVVGQGSTTLQNVTANTTYNTTLVYSLNGTPQGNVSCTVQVDSAITAETPLPGGSTFTVPPT